MAVSVAMHYCQRALGGYIPVFGGESARAGRSEVRRRGALIRLRAEPSDEWATNQP